jgi:hypothetical protein
MAQIEVRPPAAELLAEYGPLGALVVVPDDGAECCRVGFDVLVLPEGEAVPRELVPLGAADGLPLYAAWDLDAASVERVVVTRDLGADTLTAVFL